MPLPVNFGALPAGNEPLSLLDTQFAAFSAMATIPCSAGAGPNNITLTPGSNTPTLSAYQNLSPQFVFVAAATSTAQVQFNVAGLGLFPAYKWNGQQTAQAGDVVINGIYRCAFASALAGGAGGFFLDTIGIGPITTLGATTNGALEYVIDGGGSPLTTGNKGSIYMPFFATIENWRLLADQVGSVQVDILRQNLGVPSGSMVGGGTKPNLTAQQINSSAPSGWGSSLLAAGDFVSFNITSVATITRLLIVLEYAKG